MIENIIVFEDEKALDFFPLTYTRPVYELKCGIFSLLYKIVTRFPEAHVSLVAREYLKPVLVRRYPRVPINQINTGGGALLVNGRLAYNGEQYPLFPDGEERDFVLTKGNDLVFAYLRGSNLGLVKEHVNFGLQTASLLKKLGRNVSVREVSAPLVEYVWDLLRVNQAQIRYDFDSSRNAGIIKGSIHDSAVIYEEGNVFIDKGAEIMAQCVIDARKGPVYIGEDVTVKAGSVIEGPACIGDRTIVSRGYLRQGANVGSDCRVGGEIEESVILDYSNKYHEGFVGHSYIGSWVNLGALTTTSDLKNNYSPVKVALNGRQVETGMQFLGAIMGDHTKTGIGSLIPTGALIGAGCNLFGGGLCPRNVPSFVWGSREQYMEYDFGRFVETAQAVEQRRSREFTVQERDVLSWVFTQTSPERHGFFSR